ncbi:hypothetical protein DRJ16_06780, partial [Candidatus Woesearchaeota archaeon]
VREEKKCLQCRKIFIDKIKINRKFCSRECYFQHLRENPPETRFKKGHKPFKYWLGKKRSEETKKKISETKRRKMREVK